MAESIQGLKRTCLCADITGWSGRARIDGMVHKQRFWADSFSLRCVIGAADSTPFDETCPSEVVAARTVRSGMCSLHESARPFGSTDENGRI